MSEGYEFYQGLVLRQLVVESDYSIVLRPFVREGRINAFAIDGLVGVFIKHSAKRMAPWRFAWIKINRSPRSQYAVSGNRAELPYKVANGIGLILSTLTTKLRGRIAR